MLICQKNKKKENMQKLKLFAGDENLQRARQHDASQYCKCLWSF